MSARAAFTLVELIVVLAIVGVLLGAVAPALLNQLPPRDPLVSSADSVVALLGRARRAAAERSTPVDVTIDPETRRWWVRTAGIDTTGTLALSSGVILAAPYSAATVRLHARFDPRGPATADAIVARLGRRALAIRVDPWTGMAQIARAGGEADARIR